MLKTSFWATWDTSPSRLFRTQFRMVSPKRISNPNNTGDSRNCRAGVQINDSGAALGYYVSEDGYPQRQRIQYGFGDENHIVV
ncbi:TPA: phage portal protein [Escherichia coli]|nr:phage portal protein [Escherichia coli]ELE8698213.1 phage portal protein [Escherichia coli]ELS5671061.1 phage portal protein [Escherichia coli]ELT3613697.1 phage portal protein [Escherichia coli]ELY9078664.1 phage portal protein [Escherichia coli]